MKVYFGKPRYHWISPYTILEKVMFWKKGFNAFDKKHERIINALNPISVALQNILDKIHPEIKHVKIDYWDVWSMDHTLSPIILPMLKQLKEVKHGSGYVDLEDVPPELRFTEYEEWDNNYCFDFYHETDVVKKECDVHTRYDWLLDELIWTFEQLCDEDSESQFWLEHGEIDFDDYPEDEGKMCKPLRWKKESVVDWEGLRKHQARVQNGLRLFGKYFQTLWD